MDRLRLALVSTPRSGNCWLRHMLARTLELDEIIVHHPDEVNWSGLPPRAILQLHWSRDESFVSRLAEHGFRPVVLARHPLGVLISILAFSQHDDSTLRWLAGAGGDERPLMAAAPLDEAFLEYATGPRAKALLSVSTEWWQAPGACRVRYPDLVSDAGGQLQAIVSALGVLARESPAEVAASSRPNDMQAHNVHMLFHVWQAQHSLWRRFLTAAAARRICDAHSRVLETLQFACDPDEGLSAAEARANWDRYDAAAVKRHLHGVKKKLIEAEARRCHDLNGQQAALHRHQGELARQQSELERQRAEIESVLRQLEQWRVRQADFDGLGPWSLGAARRLQRWSHRLPRLAAAFKLLVAFWRRMRSRVARAAMAEKTGLAPRR